MRGISGGAKSQDKYDDATIFLLGRQRKKERRRRGRRRGKDHPKNPKQIR